MILNNLFNDFRPSFKCGTALGIGLGLSGGSNLLNTAVGIRTNSYNAHLQQEMAAEQMAWQTEEAEKARSYNTLERQATQEYNTSEREAAQAYNYRMWNLENQYNAPDKQAARLRAAGINPAIAMGQNGVSSVSVQSAPSHGASSSPGSSPMPAQVQGISPVQQPLGLDVKALASMISSLAGARKDSVEADRILKLTDKQVEQIANDAQLKKALSDSYQIDNQIKSADLPYRYKNAYYKARSLQYDALNSYLDGDLKTAQIKLTEANERLSAAERSLTDAKQQLVALDVKNYNRNLDSLIKNRASQNASNYAQADRDRASADLTRLEKTIRHNMQGAIEGEIYENWQNAAKQGKILGSQISAAEAIAEQARYAADNKEIVFWKDLIIDVLSEGANIANVFATFKNAKSWRMMSESSKDRVQQRIEEMQWKYGDQSTVTDVSPSGKKRTSTYHTKRHKYQE